MAVVVGQRFGRLVVLAVSPSVHVRCDCGREKTVQRSNIHTGRTRSCGCLQDEARRRGKHGHARTTGHTAEYAAWSNMINRCTRPETPCFSNYGGRGIKVCKRWLKAFTAFLEDMGPRPRADFTLDRIDINGNYTPKNCRWASWQDQSRNKQTTRLLTFQGKTQCLEDWAAETGIVSTCIGARIDKLGWSVEKALSTPPKAQGSVEVRRARLHARRLRLLQELGRVELQLAALEE